MTGSVKCVLVTLVALVTAGIISVSPSYAEGSAGTSATSTASTFTATTAARAYRALRAKMAAEKKAGKKVRPITYLPRVRTLKASLRAPMVATTLSARPGMRRDADGLVTFFTGSNDTATCLSLRTGAVVPGRCGYLYEQAPRSMTYAYETLSLTVTWFDQHEGVYGEQARDTALIDSVLASEIANTFSATYRDDNADGTIDDGLLTLTDDHGCGTITLPEHDPLGQTYSSNLAHGVC